MGSTVTHRDFWQLEACLEGRGKEHYFHTPGNLQQLPRINSNLCQLDCWCKLELIHEGRSSPGREFVILVNCHLQTRSPLPSLSHSAFPLLHSTPSPPPSNSLCRLTCTAGHLVINLCVDLATCGVARPCALAQSHL